MVLTCTRRKHHNEANGKHTRTRLSLLKNAPRPSRVLAAAHKIQTRRAAGEKIFNDFNFGSGRLTNYKRLIIIDVKQNYTCVFKTNAKIKYYCSETLEKNEGYVDLT